ncbi:hypothetical protein [Anditalea andensis]|uniref:Outer membrane protein beta-barrel domain-containing protein n=1 Tax=Anditalea andensis TaxID=1048983 RepID=A0A074KQU2_9BACT|nr:hypothetical protein [Anditalea andensis]KEO72326.1 hypothetical protein EL17_16390 [Anditalea andensis]
MKKYFLVMLLYISWGTLSAQGFIGTLNAKGGIPISDFRNTVGNKLVPELSFLTMYQLPEYPILVGLELGYSRYGTHFSKRDDVLGANNQTMRIRRNNNLISLMGVIRLVPEVPTKVKPFLEGQVGAYHPFTGVTIKETVFSEAFVAGTEFYDWALAYQGGGGCFIPIGKDMFMEFKLNYIYTNRMEYLTKEDATYLPDGEVTFTPRRSSFSMIQPSIGVSFFLD